MTLSPAQIHVHDDAAHAQRAVAALVCSLLAAKSPELRFSLALSGGTTPQGLYRLLASELAFTAHAARLEVFWGDERGVPKDHADSNYRMAAATLLRHVPIQEQQIHRIATERFDPAADYEQELARALGGTPGDQPPALDLVLLGMGSDGHTASLFPQTPALREERRWVVASTGPSGDRRYTMTAPMLRAARRLVMLVAGAEKAPALRAVLLGPADPERWPAQLVADQAEWFVDRAAARELGDAFARG
jgi:6-phosphogluconolactonase